MIKYDSQFDKMTKAPVEKLVLSLSVPTILSMLVTNIYNLVDTLFVGKLGTSASGAVGIVFGFMAILQAFGFMYGQGAGSILSRLLGQKDTEQASKISSTGFFMSFGTGILIAVISVIFMNPVLRGLGSTDTILPYAKTYVTFIIIAAPFMMSTFTLNNLLRYEGKASLAMIGLLSGAVLNMAGDPLFMFVFDMGIAGAGLSTAISQIISFSILLSMFLLGKTDSKISPHNITRKFSEAWEIVATGFPSLIRQGLSSIATVVLNQNAAVYGDAAVAAMSIVSRISMFIFSVGIGLGQGFQPVSGFNFGAGRFDRIRKAFKFTTFISLGLMGLMAALVLFFSGEAIQIFRDDEAVIEIGTFALRIQCMTMFLQPICITTNMLYQSTGQKLGATIVSMFRSGLFFIPVLLILAPTMGLLGIQIAQPVADVFTFFATIPFAVRYFKKYR